MELRIENDADKSTAFDAVESYLINLEIGISDADDTRPWGGSIYIDTGSLDKFLDAFFPNLPKEDLYRYGKDLGPKVMIIGPGHKQAWQYHNRRAEIWSVVHGPVGVLESTDDKMPADPQILQVGEVIKHGKGIRHRLLGLETWGVVPEIWQHTDTNNLSDEEDIVRLEDAYGRS
jgi:mannose-6-phosphate isomerase